MRAPTISPLATRVVLAAATIAACLARGQVPAAKDLFMLSAAVVESARAGDLVALELGADGVAALIDQIPAGAHWDRSRGHLGAVREFAWLYCGCQRL